MWQTVRSWLLKRIRPLRYWWKPLSWVWATLLLGVAVNVGSTWLTTKQWQVEDTPLSWLLAHVWLLIPLLSALVVFTVLAALASTQERVHTTLAAPLSLEATVLQSTRERMCQRLARWYQMFLDASLMQANWLDLDLVETLQAVTTPVSLIIQQPDQPDKPLPSGTPIIQVFDEAGQELLLLGAPGVGKSTLLYQLAQLLLQRAVQDKAAPLPIVLNLSRWAPREAPLDQWMVEQLVQVYQAPRSLAQHWVATQSLLPLLDGLDEMKPEARPRCIAAINAFHQERPALVVCSRSAEYATASRVEQLTLQRAVVVQPLTPTQITDALRNGGRKLAGLRTAYRDNPALSDLLAVPLFLNLFTLVYQGVTARTLPTRKDALQRQVFMHYVQRMLDRKREPRGYAARQMQAWLVWLAQQMHSHEMTQWGLEDLRPDWLAAQSQRIYQWSTGLFFGLSMGVYLGLLSELLVGLEYGSRLGPYFGLFLELILGPIYGLFIGALFAWVGEPRAKRKAQGSKSNQLIEPLQPPLDPVSTMLLALVAGLFFGLVVGLVFGLLLALFSGLFLGQVAGLTVLSAWMFVGPSACAIFGSLFGLRDELRTTQIIGGDGLAPAEGVRRSLKNGLLVALVLGLIVGLVFGPTAGLFIGLTLGLMYGLGSYLQHLSLRFCLWREGSLPWRLVPFLEDACTRHLLKRVGGRYQFMHALLQDYFAEH